MFFHIILSCLLHTWTADKIVYLAIWVILLNLVRTENLQVLAIFGNLTANKHGFFFPKLVKYQ